MRKLLMLLIVIFTIFMVGCGDTKHINITDTAQNSTIATLKQDNLIEDAAIDIKEDDATVCIAIKVKEDVSKQKATDLIDTAVRQLASHSGGKTPTKDYLGELWEYYTVKVLVFSNNNQQISTGIKAAGQHNHIIIE